MRPPFPGMDPWLEHPTLWPDVHNSLIAGIRDALAPRLAPKYYVGLEERTYLIAPEEDEALARPDLSVVETRPGGAVGGGGNGAEAAEAAEGMVQVVVPVSEPMNEWFLEVRQVGRDGRRDRFVTIIEILLPVSKRTQSGRNRYLRKRQRVLDSQTSLVEVDLLRAGEPMPLNRPVPASDYRILVARGRERPRATLYTFSVRDAIPAFPVPLLRGDEEPLLELGPILHGLYERARFDLRLDYRRPPEPPLRPVDEPWVREILRDRA